MTCALPADIKCHVPKAKTAGTYTLSSVTMLMGKQVFLPLEGLLTDKPMGQTKNIAPANKSLNSFTNKTN